MSLGFRLIFLCWPLDPDSHAEAVSAGSQHMVVSGYTSSWKNSFCAPGDKQTHLQPTETLSRCNACIHQVVVQKMTHPDPRHLEGHRLYGAPGEHERHGHLHVSHVALGLGQEGQTLDAQTGSDVIAGFIKEESEGSGFSFSPYEAPGS